MTDRTLMPADVLEAQAIVKRLCELQEEVVRNIFGYGEPNDCFCGSGGYWPIRQTMDFQTSYQGIEFIEKATRKAIKKKSKKMENA